MIQYWAIVLVQTGTTARTLDWIAVIENSNSSSGLSTDSPFMCGLQVSASSVSININYPSVAFEADDAFFKGSHASSVVFALSQGVLCHTKI